VEAVRILSPLLMPCGILYWYQSFGGTCCPTHFDPEDRRSMLLGNTGIHLRYYMGLQARRPQCEYSKLWKPKYNIYVTMEKYMQNIGFYIRHYDHEKVSCSSEDCLE
jgi:hypothetical protein